MFVVLDSGVVDLLITPRATTETSACGAWFEAHVRGGTQVVLPDVVDYERRRALLFDRRAAYLRGLDELGSNVLYLRITPAALRSAAELWAEARRMGRKTADDKALDVDMILCAQARSLRLVRRHVVVATTNVRHLVPFVDARRWEDVPAPGSERA